MNYMVIFLTSHLCAAAFLSIKEGVGYSHITHFWTLTVLYLSPCYLQVDYLLIIFQMYALYYFRQISIKESCYDRPFAYDPFLTLMTSF